MLKNWLNFCSDGHFEFWAQNQQRGVKICSPDDLCPGEVSFGANTTISANFVLTVQKHYCKNFWYPKKSEIP